jgi:hypothetical protein
MGKHPGRHRGVTLGNATISSVKCEVELSLLRTDAKQLIYILLMREYYSMKYICRVKVHSVLLFHCDPPSNATSSAAAKSL